MGAPPQDRDRRTALQRGLKGSWPLCLGLPEAHPADPRKIAGTVSDLFLKIMSASGFCGNILCEGVQAVATHEETNKYAYLDQLSTSELKKILRADAESPESGDVEAIFYILEVIERRKRKHPTGSHADIEQSWRDFQTIYNIPEGKGLCILRSAGRCACGMVPAKA